jgi:eukaryotic-like serine/threonine-protein kinase
MSRSTPGRGSGSRRATRRVPRTLAGRYKIGRRVGAGGMADVYLAEDTQLGRDVALKVLHSQYAGDASFIERFKREALAAARLQQNNIVQVYDSGRDGDFHFIVMEYVEGSSLKEYLADNGPLETSEAVGIAREVLSALAYAHRNGLVHRDVKPGNILLSDDGEVHVTDFGIARAEAESTMTQTGTILGTAYYLSPEQAQGNELDGRSDIYSLGVVLYEMLTGKRPFEGDSPVTIAYKQVREQARPPSHHNPDIPSPLEAIVLTAMAKRPEDRYSSAALMRRDLEAFRQGRKVTATTMVPTVEDSTQVIHKVGPMARQASKRPGWLIALALTLLAGGLAIGTWSLVALMGEALGSVEVPTIVGESPDAAESRLRSAGLEPRFLGPEDSDTIEEGLIVRQQPLAGANVAGGSQVRYWVSSGLPRVSVPQVTGMSIEQARSALGAEGLSAGQVFEVFSEAELGTVVGQNPRAGQVVRAGETVDLEVSVGEQTSVLPNVIGQSEADAVASLANARFQVNRVREPHPTVPAGFVSDQDPEPGEEAPVGAIVTITISQGPEDLRMPRVIGETEANARAELEGMGLVVSVREEIVTNPNQVGRVIAQDPPQNTPVRAGDQVTITVGRSP